MGFAAYFVNVFLKSVARFVRENSRNTIVFFVSVRQNRFRPICPANGACVQKGIAEQNKHVTVLTDLAARRCHLARVFMLSAITTLHGQSCHSAL